MEIQSLKKIAVKGYLNNDFDLNIGKYLRTFPNRRLLYGRNS